MGRLFFLNHKRYIHVFVISIALYAAFMVFVAAFFLWGLKRQATELSFAAIVYTALPQREEEPAYFNILDGASARNAAEALVVAFGVIIDNHPRSHPQEGIDKAALVFEVPVEGGATRFLALFNPAITVAKIGPVRSARPYFVDIARPLASLLAHAGGSKEALAILTENNAKLIDIDEIGPSGVYFWRDKGGFSPHNLFTNSELLIRALRTRPPELQKEDAYARLAWDWHRNYEDSRVRLQAPDMLKNVQKATHVTIDYSTFAYQVEYAYKEETHQYERMQAGKAHLTGQGSPIRIDNLIIAYVAVDVIDSEGRLKIDLVGSGNALSCMQGYCQESKWQKESSDDRFKFFVNDMLIKFMPGHTWIHLVPLGRSVTLSE